MSSHINGARLRVNAPHVIHEAIEGEVIVIDLATGSYFSLRASAADVWQLIARSPGVTSVSLVDSLASSYGDPRDVIEPAVTHFLNELLEENLVVSMNGDDPGPPSPELEHGTLTSAQAFEAPSFEKYTDMQDLVLIDPVHEVDERGWPHVPPDDPQRASSA
jgi:Coenzyme PQQ synthesis protein D (PqqD)